MLAQRRREHAAGTRFSFVVDVDGTAVGAVEVRRDEPGTGDPHTGDLSWWLFSGHRGRGWATRAARMLVDRALTERPGRLGVRRVEAQVDPRNDASQRVATRSGLRREGVRRRRAAARRTADATDVVYARLGDDPPLSEPEGFRALLNSFLPRKRAISQMLVRDQDGGCCCAS